LRPSLSNVSQWSSKHFHWLKNDEKLLEKASRKQETKRAAAMSPHVSGILCEIPGTFAVRLNLAKNRRRNIKI
jgi:hypothetical protein